jgi:hypothetical protein
LLSIAPKSIAGAQSRQLAAAPPATKPVRCGRTPVAKVAYAAIARTPLLGRAGAVPANGWVERILFLRGRLVAASAAGLTVVDPDRVAESRFGIEGSQPSRRILR